LALGKTDKQVVDFARLEEGASAVMDEVATFLNLDPFQFSTSEVCFLSLT
jgi:hypothetical protein